MAYPEPIPQITGAHAKEFKKRLEEFRLTGGEQRLYRGAREFYLKAKPKE